MQNPNVKSENKIANFHPTKLCGNKSITKRKLSIRYGSIVIFAVGVFLTIAAFFIDHSSEIGFLLRIISPSSAKAREGAKTLRSEKMLIFTDTGFSQISRIFIDELATQNLPEKVKEITVVVIKVKSTGLAFSSNSVRETIPIEFELSNGQKIEWDLKKWKR